MDLLELFVQVMKLSRDQCALVIKKSICFLAAGTTQRQRHSDGINATASLCAGILTFRFFRHPGPHSLGLEAIETDENLTGNQGTISDGMGRISGF